MTVVPGGHLSVILVVIIGFWQWGVRKGQNMAQNAAHAVNPMQKSWLRSPGEAPKWLKGTRNGPETISPIYLSLFPGSLTYLGASRGLQSQKFCIYMLQLTWNVS